MRCGSEYSEHCKKGSEFLDHLIDCHLLKEELVGPLQVGNHACNP